MISLLLSMMPGQVPNWNKNIFGNVFRQKRRILARLGGIQKSRCHMDNHFLMNLECDLIKQYDMICDNEAMLWRQKSREKWVQDGDRNTKFFHLTTMVRRRRNKIDGLFDATGTWCDSPETMKSIAKDFFENLFTANNDSDCSFYIPLLFPEVDCSWDLSLPVEAKEIKSALFAIGGLKTPGPDGFPAIFFQKHWNLCGNEIIKLVSTAFSSGSIPEGLNNTLITLVPKIQSLCIFLDR